MQLHHLELLETWQRNEVTVCTACQAEWEVHWHTELDKLQQMKEKIEEKVGSLKKASGKVCFICGQFGGGSDKLLPYQVLKRRHH